MKKNKVYKKSVVNSCLDTQLTQKDIELKTSIFGNWKAVGVGYPYENLKELLVAHLMEKEPKSRLIRKFEFSNFKTSMSFLNDVAKIDNIESNLLELSLRSKEVKVEIQSLDIEGITERSFIVADACDKIYKNMMQE